MKTYIRILSLAMSLGLAAVGHAGSIFSENFESPNVSTTSALQFGGTFKKGALPGTGRWVGSTQGFGADRIGLINKTFGDFTAPTGNNQGFFFAYTNSGITTSTTAITETLATGRKYALTFDVARDNGVTSSTYTMQLVAFGTSDTNALRAECRSGLAPGVVLASAGGTVTSNDLSKHVTINFQPDAVTHAAQMGKTLGIRFLGNGTLPILDNVELSVTLFDSDSDGLNDDWEIVNFGNLSHDGSADTDGDKLSDAFEFKLGLNPTSVDTNQDGVPDWGGIPGYLTVEQWNGIAGAVLSDFYSSNAFYQQAANFYFVSSSKTPYDQADNYGLRMRGTVIAPVSGAYTFWLAGGGESVLYLSTDATPFNRRKLATVDTAPGKEQWDQFPSQKSASVQLVAGQQYYIETLMKAGTATDHLAIAWQYTGQTRQIIPAARLKSLVPNANDLDDDGMLDSWEAQVGLFPNDNGAIDRNQSGYLDADSDGLLTFEEYLFGGNPFQVGGNKGYLEFDVWKDIAGSSIQSLVQNSKFTEVADLRAWLNTSFTSGWGTNYGGRMRGTLTPSATGEYHFYVAGDDAVELWLSSTSDRFNKKRIAWSREPTNQQQWTKYPSQRSGAIQLVAGQSYYIEALVKNANSSDHLSIGWSLGNTPQVVWTSLDIGGLTQSATWTENADSVSVSSTGGDVWNYADAFTFRYMQLSGDGVLIAHIPSINAANVWAKVGLMVRGSLAAGSQNVMVLRTGDGRIVHQGRGSVNGITLSGYRTEPLQPDTWLRLARVGSTIQASSSEDGITWKQFASGGISLPETAYFGLAVSGIPGNNVDAVFDHISCTKSFGIELLPSSVLTSITPDANDLDDDNLPDAWETQMGLDASTAANSMGQYGDPDGDGVNNFEELQFGGDPLEGKGVAANLTRELWTSDPTGSVHDFVRTATFLRPADRVELLPACEFQSIDEVMGFGQRVRGRVVALASGWYRFWIAGSNDCELWLSTDETKFNKRKIAQASNTGFRQWDEYGSSELIYLNEGHPYFIEILHKDVSLPGHFSVAWSHTAQLTGVATPRVLIPSSQLRTYIPDANDADDDYLPDTWEIANGLSATDNGLNDPKNGYYGDLDGDGLDSAAEFKAGTRADLADTDGDGVSDRDELKLLETQALSADAAPFENIATIPGASYTATLGSWIQENGKARQNCVRGWLEYPVTLATSGVYQLDLAFSPIKDGDVSPEYEILFSADGHTIQRETVTVAEAASGHARILSPWLTAGSHTIRVFIDNSNWFRRVTVDQLEILAARGQDVNSNGTPDWIDLRLAKYNSLEAPAGSLTSPVCLEGKAKWSELTTIAGATVQTAPDDRWYADVPLDASQPTQVSASLENGGLTTNYQINWLPTNLLTTSTVDIRLGDSLKLSAFNGTAGTPQETVTITLEGQTTTITADQPLVHTFAAAGSVPVQITHSRDGNLTTATATINVVAAPLIDSPVCVAGYYREFSIPALPYGVTLQFDNRIDIRSTTANTDGSQRHILRLNTLDDRPSVFRLGGSFGPILNTLPFRLMRVRAAEETANYFGPDLDETTWDVIMPIVVDGNYQSASITLNIFIGGVVFEDGSLTRTLLPDSHPEFQWSELIHFYKTGITGSNCHRMSIWQGNLRIAYFQ